jgi:DNA-directed RNA polymerase subunit N (RpoN/RPB10)
MKPTRLLCVDIREAKANKMFSEEQRQLVRFLIYNRPIPCAACGRKTRSQWTHLTEFTAVDFEHSYGVARDFPKVFAPLTPVCCNHPLGLPRKRKLLAVHLRAYKPDRIAPQFVRWTQPLRYSRAIPCAHCGKKTCDLWTALFAFRVQGDGQTTYAPLTPVCFTHRLKPATDAPV